MKQHIKTHRIELMADQKGFHHELAGKKGRNAYKEAAESGLDSTISNWERRREGIAATFTVSQLLHPSDINPLSNSRKAIKEEETFVCLENLCAEAGAGPPSLGPAYQPY